MEVKAYVDGSYNVDTGAYGAGAVLIVGEKEYELSQPGALRDAASMRNVAGEILAAMLAATVCTKLGNVTKLTIYHDYQGLAEWVAGRWKAKNPYTQSYVHMMTNLPFAVEFSHVPAHTGVYHNELADRLAKKAAGIID